MIWPVRSSKYCRTWSFTSPIPRRNIFRHCQFSSVKSVNVINASNSCDLFKPWSVPRTRVPAGICNNWSNWTPGTLIKSMNPITNVDSTVTNNWSMLKTSMRIAMNTCVSSIIVSINSNTRTMIFLFVNMPRNVSIDSCSNARPTKVTSSRRSAWFSNNRVHHPPFVRHFFVTSHRWSIWTSITKIYSIWNASVIRPKWTRTSSRTSPMFRTIAVWERWNAWRAFTMNTPFVRRRSITTFCRSSVHFSTMWSVNVHRIFTTRSFSSV